MGERKVIAIDFGRESLKCVVLGVQKDVATVEACYAELLPLPLDADAAAWRAAALAVLKKWKSDGAIPKGAVVVAAPSAHALVRALKVPTATLRQKLAEEAGQQLPFPINELDWDQIVIATEGDQSYVSLAAIKKDINADLLALCADGGIDPAAIGSGAMALGNLLLHRGGGSCASPVAVLGIGATGSNLTIVDGTKVWMRTNLPVTGSAIIAGLCKNLNLSEADARKAIFSGINVAVQSDTESDAAKNVRATVSRLVMEITRSLTFYKSQLEGEKPQKLYLVGGYSMVNGLREFLAERLKMDVECLDVFTGMKSDAVAHPEWFGEALGCALEGAGLARYSLNMLPKQVQAQRALDRRKPFLVAAAFCLAAVFALLYGVALKDNIAAAASSRDAETQLARAQTFDRQIADIRKKMDADATANESLRRVLWDRDMTTHILAEASRRMPSNCWISSIEIVPFFDEYERIKREAEVDGMVDKLPVVKERELLRRSVLLKINGGCYGNWADLQPKVEADLGRISGVSSCIQKQMTAQSKYSEFRLDLALDWNANGVADLSDITNTAAVARQ